MTARTRNLIVFFVIAAVLLVLLYLQVRTWQSFDWRQFVRQTRDVNFWKVAIAVVLIYSTYYVRAIRWKIMLQPVRKTRAGRLLAPTIIGFTGLALLGRPGELVRPYLIARKENLTFPSQLAVWTVERIFDIGTFAVMLALDLIFADSLRRLPYFEQFRRAGFVLLAGVSAVAVIAYAIHKRGEWIEALVERLLGRFPRFAGRISRKIRSFHEGLDTLTGFAAFAKVLGLSALVWVSIAAVYWVVITAYPQAILEHMSLPHVMLLMAASIVGSAVQLPVVGGGSQLAVISVMVSMFGMPNELAVSCGIMLWLVTFMSAAPGGLLLARREHIKLTEISQQTHQE